MLPLLWQPLSTEAVILFVMVMVRLAGSVEGVTLEGLLLWGRGGGFSKAQSACDLEQKE